MKQWNDMKYHVRSNFMAFISVILQSPDLESQKIDLEPSLHREHCSGTDSSLNKLWAVLWGSSLPIVLVFWFFFLLPIHFFTPLFFSSLSCFIQVCLLSLSFICFHHLSHTSFMLPVTFLFDHSCLYTYCLKSTSWGNSPTKGLSLCYDLDRKWPWKSTSGRMKHRWVKNSMYIKNKKQPY